MMALSTLFEDFPALSYENSNIRSHRNGPLLQSVLGSLGDQIGQVFRILPALATELEDYENALPGKKRKLRDGAGVGNYEPKSNVIVSNKDDTFKIILDTSQYQPEEICVKIINDKLAISAKHEAISKDVYEFCEMYRSFDLPKNKNIDSNAINCHLSASGQLTVEIPLKSVPESVERIIPVEIEGKLAAESSKTALAMEESEVKVEACKNNEENVSIEMIDLEPCKVNKEQDYVEIDVETTTTDKEACVKIEDVEYSEAAEGKVKDQDGEKIDADVSKSSEEKNFIEIAEKEECIEINVEGTKTFENKDVSTKMNEENDCVEIDAKAGKTIAVIDLDDTETSEEGKCVEIDVETVKTSKKEDCAKIDVEATETSKEKDCVEMDIDSAKTYEKKNAEIVTEVSNVAGKTDHVQTIKKTVDDSMTTNENGCVEIAEDSNITNGNGCVEIDEGSKTTHEKDCVIKEGIESSKISA